ncbi:MAG: hypothetical protein ACQEXJ_08970 [Myxococcota bacterium]
MAESSGLRVVGIVAVVLVVIAAGGAALWTLAPGGPGEGPVDIVWDKETCAWCHMHVSEPAFAAQVRTREGDVHVFDDPGCLFAWQADRHADLEGVWFHHVDEDRWIPADDAAFVERSPTPMGYGLGAVDRGQGIVSLSGARARTLQQDRDESAKGAR